MRRFQTECRSEHRSPYTTGLQDAATGRCLDSNAKGQVYTSPCQVPGNRYQDWMQDVNNRNAFSDYATNLYLDSDGSGSAYTHSGFDGNFQNWWHIW